MSLAQSCCLHQFLFLWLLKLSLDYHFVLDTKVDSEECVSLPSLQFFSLVRETNSVASGVEVES